MVHSGICCQRVTFVRLIWQNGGPSVHQLGPSIKPSNYPCSSIHPTKIRTKFGINHLSLSLKFKARIHEEAIISSPRSHARHANWLRAGFRTPSTCTKCCWCRERERERSLLLWWSSRKAYDQLIYEQWCGNGTAQGVHTSRQDTLRLSLWLWKVAKSRIIWYWMRFPRSLRWCNYL